MSNEYHMFTAVLSYVKSKPYPNTHIIIGGAARYTNINEYTSDIQQIIEPWKDMKQPTRYIHFDPNFNYQIKDGFIKIFLETKGKFNYDNSEGMHIFRSFDNIIELIFICQTVYYSQYISNNHFYFDSFLEEMIHDTLLNNSKMIVQDYSGKDTKYIFKQLYNKSYNKKLFKNNILFDFTYGNNHCDVDFKKYQPIIDSNNNFINILLMSIEELKKYYHQYPIIDEIILKHYTDEKSMYRFIIDTIVIDIRRQELIRSGEEIKIKGYNEKYSVNTSKDKMIQILKQELDPIIKEYRELGIMNPEKEALLDELLTNYNSYTLKSSPNIYDWSTQFMKICSIK